MRIVRTTVVGIIGVAAVFFRAAFAQSTGAGPAYTTADIHPSRPNTILEMRSRFFRGRYELRVATLVDLIRTAWGVDADKVVGGPDWLDTDRFDLIADAPPASTPEALQTMLRGILAARFHLVAHRDTREGGAWAMTAVRKLQLRPTTPDNTGETGCKAQPSTESLAFVCRNTTMEAFASTLPGMRGASGYLFNYPVIDRTDLKGAYDYDVKWSLPAKARSHQAQGDAITLFDALAKQLGLKLTLIKVSTRAVVVDSVNRNPSPNAPGIDEKPTVPPAFEVATIKPDEHFSGGSYVSIRPGGRVTINMTLKGLIQEAWGDMNPWRVVGGPKSFNATRFEVVARAPAEEEAQAGWRGMVWNGVDIDSMRMMLRALLIDRFKLAAHEEERDVDGYALVSSKQKLRKADSASRPGCKEGPRAGEKDPRLVNPVASRLITCRNVTLVQFADELNNILYGYPPVVESTGLAGRYDLTINFTPPSALPNTAIPNAGETALPEPDGTISLFDALKSQLGLKLESRKVKATVLVIDRVNETPFDN